MAKKQDAKPSFKVYLVGLFGALLVEADRWELVVANGYLYVELYAADEPVATFPERNVTGIVRSSHEVAQQPEAFNAFRP